MDAAALKALLDGGTIMVALAALWIVWKELKYARLELKASREAHIDDLRRLVFTENPKQLPPHTAGAPSLAPSLN